MLKTIGQLTVERNYQEAIVPYLLRNKVVSLPDQVWSIDTIAVENEIALKKYP